MYYFYNQKKLLLKNQTIQVHYKVMSLLLHVAALAPRAEAASLACDGQGPSPQRDGSEAPALLLVGCNSSGVLIKQQPVLTATPWLAATRECHSGKTAADDNDILFFLLSYHTVPCTPFSACLLGGPAPSIISFLQNLQSLLPHWYLPLSLPADMHKSLLKEKGSRPGLVAPSLHRSLSASSAPASSLGPLQSASSCRVIVLPTQALLPILLATIP